MKETPHHVTFGTFGIYRYILASMVVVTHIGPDRFMRLGNYAVFAFFILSGYVVSYILSQRYLHLDNGVRKYLLNRGLRIFPLYWIAVLASLPLLIAYPVEAAKIQALYQLPHTAQDWVWNIIAIGMADPLTGALNATAIISVSWSLGIEILFWALLPKYVKHPEQRKYLLRFSLIYTALATAVTISMHHLAQPLQLTNALAAALPFCTGLYIFGRNERGIAFPHRSGSVAVVLFLCIVPCAPLFRLDPHAAGFLMAFGINALLIQHLSQVETQTLPRWLQRLDKGLGHLSYPLYLVHVPVALLIHLAWPALPLHTFTMWGVTLVIASLLSLALHYTVEVPVDRFRRRIKS